MTKRRVVRWVAPLGLGQYSYTCVANADDIISFMKEEYQENHKNHPNYPYKTDEDALLDFVAINWAEVYDDLCL